MKIVIDIPESDYRRIMASNEVEYYELKIALGTPLPKGHGDLIDRSVLVNELNEQQIEFDEFYKGLGRAKTITNNVPTVIEADKENKND